MKIKFWKYTKTYYTELGTYEINKIISTRLGTKQILFLNPINIGTITIDKFNYTAFRPGRIFPIKVKSTLEQEKTITLLNVEYKAIFNPLIILIPVWAFFILLASIDNFTLNGDQVSAFLQIVLCVTLMLIISLFIFLATIASIRTEMLNLETALMLKN